MAATGRRLLTTMPQLTRRAWEDVAPELERFLLRLWDSEGNGIPAGNGTTIPTTTEAGDIGAVGNPGSGWAPMDHEHPVVTGVPSGLANTTQEGVSTALPRLDHKHKRDVRTKANGADAGTRNALNFKPSANIAWTLTDDALDDEVEVQAALIPGTYTLMKEVELDFGTPAVVEKVFTVTDAAVTAISLVNMLQSGAAATGRQADEAEFDAIDCRCEPFLGGFRVYATSLLGSVLGKYKFNYALM